MGPVVDLEFKEGELPPIFTAIRITNPLINDKKWNLVLEVAQQLGGRRVRCIAMDSTDGIKRGEDALDTGEGISIPVGKEALGRLMNVVGEPIDEFGPIEAKERWPIHRPAPQFVEQSTKLEVFETGIKVVDLLAPFLKASVPFTISISSFVIRDCLVLLNKRESFLITSSAFLVAFSIAAIRAACSLVIDSKIALSTRTSMYLGSTNLRTSTLPGS